MGSDQVGINCQPEYPETALQAVFPNGLLPFGRASLEQFATPDIIHKHIDPAVIPSDLLGQTFHLLGI